MSNTLERDEKDRFIRKVIPAKGIRKIIGIRMRESLQKSPQATVITKADMAGLISFRNEYVSNRKISFTDLFVKISAIALQENPILNASLQDGKIIFYESINIGVAMAIDDNLFVPVLKDIPNKDLQAIASELEVIKDNFKKGQLEKIDMSGGTFTISNMGMYDVDGMTPIINPPEAAIMSIGATRNELIVNEDLSTEIKPITTLSLTLDHALMDGVPGAKFLETVKRIMKNPRQYLQ